MRRNRKLQICLFIIIYACYYAHSAAVDKEEVIVDEVDETTNGHTSEEVEETTIYEREDSEELEDSLRYDNHTYWYGHPTLRPPRQNCTAPAIEQYPETLMPARLREVKFLIS